MSYPQTRVEDLKELLFGVSVADPYRWLEDGKAEEVRAWMSAQDRFARDHLEKLSGREALTARLRELYYVDAISAPVHRGGRYFYTRRHADKEKAVVYWREWDKGAEHVLIDPNLLSSDGSTSLGVWVPTWDGKRVAYALKENNSDEATLHVIEVATGQVSERDVIEGAKYAQPSWTPKGDGFYYTYLPSGPNLTVSDRPGYAEIRYHALGTDPKSDRLIHERTGNPRTFIGAGLSRDGHWLFVYVQHGWNSTDVYFRDTRKKDLDWKPLVVGVEAQYEIEAHRDRFYVLSNEGAPRWRVLEVDPRKVERKSWRELVPEAPDSVLQGAQVIGGHLVLTRLRNAASELEVLTLAGKPVRKVPLPGIGATGGMTGNPDEDEAYFSFTSFTRPPEVHRTSIKSGETSMWAQVKLPIDASRYTVEQVWYPSKDGTRISMFLVHRKDLQKDRSTPFLLTGYGGFNVSRLPEFSSGLYPWLDAGGGFALPNLRGGGEYGEDWHKAGMGARKQNVFDDFIGAAEYLIQTGYTAPERLAIRGGSNGGLLMGAAMTQRPDLFRAVVCAVPLLDMVRYHLFGSGKTWIPEYGSAEDQAGFTTLYGYSPYHHVKPGTRYPALLMLSADSDDRVDPMHARKMTAAVQAAVASAPSGAQDPRPVLLRIEPHSGHGGADLVRQAVTQSADMYAFLMRELGMAPRRSE